MMSLSLIEDVAEQPVSLEEAKSHLRVDNDAEEALISMYIDASIKAVEAITGRDLYLKQWTLFLDKFPSGAIEIPYAPLSAVFDFYYTDLSGATVAFFPNTYQKVAPYGTLAAPGQVLPLAGEMWPDTMPGMAGAVQIRFLSGYTALPASLRAAVLLMVGDLYQNREASAESGGSSARVLNTNPTVDRLLAPFKVYQF